MLAGLLGGSLVFRRLGVVRVRGVRLCMGRGVDVSS